MFTFKQVTEESRLEEIYRLRYHILGHEMGYYHTSDYPDGMLEDRYDSSSVHFAAFDERENIVAAARLTLGEQCGKEMPVFGMQVPWDPAPDIGLCMELGKLVVDPKYRRKNLAMGIYRSMLNYSARNTFEFLYSIQTMNSFNKLCRLGIPYKTIGPEIDYMGGPSVPCFLDLNRWRAKMQMEQPQLWQWFRLDSSHLQALHPEKVTASD